MDSTWLILAGIVLGAHAAETLLGFGATLIALALGVHFVPLEVYLSVLVMLGIVQSLWLVWRGRRRIAWKKLLSLILPASAAGTAIGVWYRDSANEGQLTFLLGIFVICIAVWELALTFRGHKSAPLKLPSSLGFLAGGGVFHGLFASGGPLIVYYASRAMPSAPVFRATLAVLWLTLNVGLLAELAYDGRLTERTFGLLGLLLPAALAGIAVGERIKVNDKVFRILTYSLLMFGGIMLLR